MHIAKMGNLVAKLYQSSKTVLTNKDLRLIWGETNTDMLTTKEAIEQRRSIRKFKPDAIPQEILLELIDAARLAPSGGNVQPWRFKIVTDPETKDLKPRKRKMLDEILL